MMAFVLKDRREKNCGNWHKADVDFLCFSGCAEALNLINEIAFIIKLIWYLQDSYRVELQPIYNTYKNVSN